MKNKILIIILAAVLFSANAFAENLVPKFINLQAVLVDDGGNVLRDKQEGDISFAVISAKGDVLYEEIQPKVPIINGAISVLIGAGNNPSNGFVTGGIPYDALDMATGDKLLRMKLSDQIVPQEDLQLVSTPYAYYAQYALEVKNPVTSEQILDATIKTDDLSSEVLDFINAGKNGASSALPGTAKSISVTPGHLTYATGNDVQTVLESFDHTMAIEVIRIENAEAAIKQLQSDLTTEINERKTGNADFQSQAAQEMIDRKAADQALQAALDQETSNRGTGDADLQNQVDVLDQKIPLLAPGETTLDDRYLNIGQFQMAAPPVGTIIPFYDFGGALKFDPNYWHYCDGSAVDVAGIGNQTLPDLSNRYLVGFGTDGGSDLGSAAWDTSAVGNAGHSINLQHSHAVNAHSHSTASHTHTISAHQHTVASHSHTVPVHSHTIAHTHSGPAHRHRWMFGTGSTWTNAANVNVTNHWNNGGGSGAGGTPGDDGDNDTQYASFYTEQYPGGTTGPVSSVNSSSVALTTNGSGVLTTSLESLTTDGSGVLSTDAQAPGTDSLLSPAQSIQPRSVRVRFIMRIR